MAKDLVTKGTKDSLTKDPVNHVATQEVAQVTKGKSGGSAKVKAKRRELQMKSADMLQSFSYVCRMFHFGSSRLFFCLVVVLWVLFAWLLLFLVCGLFLMGPLTGLYRSITSAFVAIDK